MSPNDYVALQGPLYNVVVDDLYFSRVLGARSWDPDASTPAAGADGGVGRPKPFKLTYIYMYVYIYIYMYVYIYIGIYICINM